MSPEDQIILGLCRIPPQGGGARAPGDIRWPGLVDTALQQRVGHLVLGELHRWELPPEVADEIAELERSEFVETAVRKGAIRETLRRVVRVLDEAGVEFLLMKGFSLDLDGRRPLRDLDVLVHEKDLERALAALKAAGHQYIGDDINLHVRADERGNMRRQLAWNNQFQLRDLENGTLLEVHTNLFERRRTHALDLDPLLDGVGIFFEQKEWDAELGCHVFPAELQLLAMCMYACVKYSPAHENLRLGILVDIDRILRRGVDRERFMEHVRRFEVTPHVHFALTLAHRLIATPVPPELERELEAGLSGRQRLATRLHLASVGTLQRNALLWSKLYIVATPFLLSGRWSDRLRWIFLVPILFPPRWKIARFFGLREDSALIPLAYLANPARWVVLLARRCWR